ncbi:MAG: type VI secretion system tip protein VgrG [Gammaproteobacteria bacterium]|nr:type VI secretion system tip protein VgrG [Gammaproteobacteria bacterium]MDH5692823.1 type VI secretion system tip protein VgrG [Gammaproteobacteria bacterium]
MSETRESALRMLNLRANLDQFLTTIGGMENVRVVEFNCTETLSELYSCNMLIATDDDELTLEDIISQPAALAIMGADGSDTRYINGIVASIRQRESGGRLTVYEVKIVPIYWTLQFRKDSRIFQEKNVQEIIEDVLAAANIASDNYEFNLSESYAVREYCVQYNESDWNFISRMLEEEGIFYFFRHDDTDSKIIFADSNSIYEDIPTEPEIPYNRQTGLVSEATHIRKFSLGREIRSGVTSSNDFLFTNPALGLGTMCFAEMNDELEVYEYPGRYEDEDRGVQLTQVRLDAMRSFAKNANGESDCQRVIPGYKFSLIDHPRDDFNAEYALVKVVHHGKQLSALEEEAGTSPPSYSNSFYCIPAETVFRPRRRAKRPVMRGMQTAIVTGGSEDEILTDRYGRVKVQFHWDRQGQRNEASSCWVRVSQLWAGAGWGAMFIPRVGHEVIIEFLEGDPDRPIITGRLYNGTNTPPNALPDNKTKSTIKSDSSKGSGGSNEITFEDKKDAEQFIISAQKDMSTSVGNNQTNSIAADRSVSVGGKFNETITGDTKIVIETGTFEHDVQTGSASYKVKGAVTETFQDAHSSTVTNNITITSTAGEITINGKNKISLISGESKIELDADGTIKISGKTIDIVGGDDVLVSSKKVSISGTDEAKIGTSNQTVVTDKTKTAISGAAINSSAVGMHEITGAVVKIN